MDRLGLKANQRSDESLLINRGAVGQIAVAMELITVAL